MMKKTNKMMRVTALLMMAVFLLCLAACGSKTNTAETQAQSAQNATAAETKAADAQQSETTANTADTATEAVSSGNQMARGRTPERRYRYRGVDQGSEPFIRDFTVNVMSLQSSTEL